MRRPCRDGCSSFPLSLPIWTICNLPWGVCPSMRLCSSCFVSLMYKSGHSSLHWTVYTILLCVLVLDPLGVIVLVCWKVWNIWGHCVCWKSSGGFQILQSYTVRKDDIVVFFLLSSSVRCQAYCVCLLFDFLISLDMEYCFDDNNLIFKYMMGISNITLK